MNVLIACEFSAVVRNAFIARGHNAWSCDLLPTEGRWGNHLQGDVRHALAGNLHRFPNAVDIRTGNTPLFIKWDLLIAHPPCTYLCNSGAKWLYKGGRRENGRDPERWRKMEEAAAFFLMFLHSGIERIAVENPIMHEHAAALVGRRAAQFVQPWQHGHGETKATGFHLVGLPKLVPTKVVAGRTPRVHHASPGPDRWRERSRTIPGIAEAMAAQWGKY